jgi:pilus assembly protein CpaB
VRASTIVMIVFAAVFGLLAVFIAQTWLNNQAEMRMKSMEAQKKPIPTRTVVVASKPLRFGQELNASVLREVEWPEGAVPPGAFSTLAQAAEGGRRVVLVPIELNEPVLASKVTGSGQRATLSALIGDGMKAVTIRVNDVEGVAGWVLPGDRVDIVLTRQSDKAGASNDVVLQNTRVLAIDQIADERADKPAIAKAVTLEVDTTAAQKLSLASAVGTLSLVLRRAGEAGSEFTRRVELSDLGTANAPAKKAQASKAVVTVVVTRASVKQEYSVPIEGAAGVVAVGQR